MSRKAVVPLPALCTGRRSIWIHDPKGELAALDAKRRCEQATAVTRNLSGFIDGFTIDLPPAKETAP